MVVSRHSIFGAIAFALAITAAVSASSDTGAPIANLVLGQADFSHSGVNIVTGAGIDSFEDSMGAGDVAIDQSVSGVTRVYIADSYNNRVLGWHTLSGFVNGQSADLVIGQPDFVSSGCDTGSGPGDVDGVGADSLCYPTSLAVDTSGNLYVSDTDNDRVLEYGTPFAACAGFPCIGGAANLVFGQDASGTDFTSSACAGTPGADSLCSPGGLAFDLAGNLFVADTGDSRVLVYNHPISVSSESGSGDVTADLEFGQGQGSGVDFTDTSCGAPPSATTLCEPAAVAIDPSGDVFIADAGVNRVLEFEQNQESPPTTFTPNRVFGQGKTGKSFTTDNDICSDSTPSGQESADYLCGPQGLGFDSNSDLFVADSGNNRVLEYDNPSSGTSGNPGNPGFSGDVTADVVFGQGADGISDSDFLYGDCNPVSSTSLCAPEGIAIDSSGNLYVADSGYNRVLTYLEGANFTPDRTASTVFAQTDFNLDGTDVTKQTGMNFPASVAVDPRAGVSYVYAADELNSRVLGWKSASSLQNGQPADLVVGQPDFASSDCNQTVATALVTAAPSPTASTLCSPSGVGVDSNGNLWVADTSNNRVLEYAAPFDSCTSFPCVGGAAAYVLGQGSVGTAASAFTANLADNGNGSPDANSMFGPTGVAIDTQGDIYVADNSNLRVLEYNTPLQVTAAAGSGDATADLVIGQGSDGVDFTAAEVATDADHLDYPQAVAIDINGNLYVTDETRVMEYLNPLASGGGTPSTPGSAGDVTADLVFGQGASGNNFSGTDCADGLGSDPVPSATGVCQPDGVAVDASLNVYVSDSSNNRVLVFPEAGNPAANVTAALVVGQDSGSDFSAVSCNLGATGLCNPGQLAIDDAGDLLVTDSGNNRAVRFQLNPGAIPTPTEVGATATPNSSATATPAVSATPTASSAMTSTPTASAVGATPTPTSSTAGTGTATPAASATATVAPTAAPSSTPTLIVAKLKISPKKLNFGKVAIGASRSKTVTVRNAGHTTKKVTALPVSIWQATASLPSFAVQNNCPSTLAPGQSCTIGVTFTPPAATTTSATLTIDHNVIGVPETVPLIGTGKAAPGEKVAAHVSCRP